MEAHDESKEFSTPVLKKLRANPNLSTSQEKFLAKLENTPLLDAVYMVTNRKIEDIQALTKDSSSFNEVSPNEVRVAKITKKDGKYVVEPYPETLDGTRGDEYIFLEIQSTMRRFQRDFIYFVHGYNNNLEVVVERAFRLRKEYDIEVVIFSWPALGGSNGTLNYRNDKRQAELSFPAFDKTLEVFLEHLRKWNGVEACNGKLTLMCHSMGNYLLQKYVQSDWYERETRIFDNIVMIAADVNNEDHNLWVDKIAHRKGLYILINENDSALLASSVKSGSDQKVRLGHYTHNLTSKVAVYLDVSEAKHVGNSHAYFEGEALKNSNIKSIFQQLFHGARPPNENIQFNQQNNCYVVM